jgi:4-diphosphocytidyl-2-C-methyl-D-erythritol kinase
VNDLERPVFEKYIFLAELKMWLLAQSEIAGALMSGSGSTIFGVLHAAEPANELQARIRSAFGQNLWCRFVRTVGA